MQRRQNNATAGTRRSNNRTIHNSVRMPMSIHRTRPPISIFGAALRTRNPRHLHHILQRRPPFRIDRQHLLNHLPTLHGQQPQQPPRAQHLLGNISPILHITLPSNTDIDHCHTLRARRSTRRVGRQPRLRAFHRHEEGECLVGAGGRPPRKSTEDHARVDDREGPHIRFLRVVG
jgi:hypothetical protein